MVWIKMLSQGSCLVSHMNSNDLEKQNWDLSRTTSSRVAYLWIQEVQHRRNLDM